MKDIQNSQYRLRKAIGILGLILPVLLLLVHQDLLASISHYYYTSASVFFIGILFAFGLILYNYKGYEIDKDKKEKFSDDWITSFAAVCIFITVLVPTKCKGSYGDLLFCDGGYLFGHCDNNVKGTIHLLCAGGFLGLLGYMCIKKFTMSPRITMRRRNFYKICGYIIWISIALIIILFSLEKFILHIDLNSIIPGYTFILETIAVWAFAVAWLVKGKIDQDFIRYRQTRFGLNK